MTNNSLNRALGPLAVIAFGLTNEIAAGLFFVSTQIQQSSPGVGNLVPLLMIVGGIITFLTVVVYRFFFGAGLVGAGGEYVIISRSLSPGIAFVVTFLAWFGFTGALGTLAYSAPKFLSTAFLSLGATGLGNFLASNVGILIVGVVILWVFWAVHVFGVKLAGTLTTIAMFLVFAVALVMIFTGFSTNHAAFDAAMAQRTHLSVASVLAASPVKHVSVSTAFATALPTLFFGYLGLSTATQTGGEAKNPTKSLAKGVLITVTVVGVLYTLFAWAVYHAVPWQVISGLAAMKQTSYTTSSGLLQFVMPSWLASLINLCVALIVAKTFLPIFLAQSRWVYAWGDDGLIPRMFSKTHARYKTPVLALTLSALFGTASLIESIKLGFVFGVNIRVLSVMLVFFFMGLGLITFPKHAPQLYNVNTSWMRRSRFLQVLLGVVLMLVSIWFSVSITMSSASSPLYLQPAFQSAIVVLIAIVIYRLYLAKIRSHGTSSESFLLARERFTRPPSADEDGIAAD
ncbi:APC family permease [Alicyclobacillus sp. ALC3]|uniref:APC family permease n=1 Tax=Alicyclobacillus sp. ALC3 TaxID=2796143 RepID=UPI002378483C|nr:APC family permease [Alicyclobacillus sp. ALC3]WDL97721.1 APC family permease [Alicyclobacillus sp. ALC3]